MRVRGEAFLLINGFMDLLALWFAACVGRRRFRPLRCLLAAGLGAVYALAAWTIAGVFRSVPALILSCFGMTWIAFGRDGPRLTALTFTGGLLLSGAAAWLMKRGGDTAEVLGLCGIIAAAVCVLTRRRCLPGEGSVTLTMDYGGKTVCMPVRRDSGNLMRWGGGNLPVIAVPEKLARPLLPPGTDLKDLSTLPRGWRLIRIRTAAGEKTAMAFEPDRAALRRGKAAAPVRAAAAILDLPGRCALAPECLYREKKEGSHAGV